MILKFKKPYIGKNWKKFFGPKSVFRKTPFFQNKYVYVIFRDEHTNKKIYSYKIRLEEYNNIIIEYQFTNDNFEHFMLRSVREYIDQKYSFPID